MTNEVGTLSIASTHMRKLKERRIDLSHEQMMAIMRIFTVSDRSEAAKRRQVTDIMSLAVIYGDEFDVNIIHTLMLCVPPKNTLELFPSLKENIWSLGIPRMRRAWRTREAVALSNDLASSGLLFHISSTPGPLLKAALLYFTLPRHANPAIESMKTTLNIDASMFADFCSLAKQPPNHLVSSECVTAILKHCTEPMNEDVASAVAPFSVLFDDSTDGRICAFDVVSNICLAVGIVMPLHISTKQRFGQRRLIYIPRFACRLVHAAIDLCIPLRSGSIAVLNDGVFWAPHEAMIKASAMEIGASPFSAQLSLESSFTAKTQLVHSLQRLHEFYLAYAYKTHDQWNAAYGKKLLIHMTSSMRHDDLYLNLHSDNAVLMILSIMLTMLEEESIVEDYIIAIIAFMHEANSDMRATMERIGRLAPVSPYTQTMPLGALIVDYVRAPKYVDPCLWACMSFFPQCISEEQTPTTAPPLSMLYDESVVMVDKYASWTINAPLNTTITPAVDFDFDDPFGGTNVERGEGIGEFY